MPRPHNLPRDMRAAPHRRQVMGPEAIASIQAAISANHAAANANNNGNGNGNGKGRVDVEDGDAQRTPARTTVATTKATQPVAQTTQMKAETRVPMPTPIKQTTENTPKAPSTTPTRAPSTTPVRHTLPIPETTETSDDTEETTSSTTKASTTSPKAAMTTSTSSLSRTSTSRTLAQSSSSISPSASAAADAANAKNGVSNGGIAGIVVGLILGIIVIGGLAGFLYRRYKSRDYNEKQPWTKMRDDPTPYRDAKRDSDDEFYGGAPMIQHQQHLGFNRELDSGAYGVAPESSYDAANMAGFGTGAAMSSRAAYGAYPDSASHVAASYDQDGRPYTPNGPHHSGYEQGYDHGYDQNGYPQQQQNPFEDGSGGSPHNTSPQQQNFGGPRQLVGPGQVYGGSGVGVPVPAPVPLGRPEAPQSYDEIAAAEMYADDRYADDHLSVPQSMPMPSAHQEPYTRDARLSPSPTNEFVNDMDFGQDNSLQLQHADLPTLAPMTPLLDQLSFDDDVPDHHTPSPAAAAAAANAQPYDASLADMYNEVARAAGVHTDDAVTYQHGQPLSPLREVPTPKSTLDSTQVPDVGYFPSPPALDTRDLPAPSGRPLPSTPVKASSAAASQDDAYGGI